MTREQPTLIKRRRFLRDTAIAAAMAGLPTSSFAANSAAKAAVEAAKQYAGTELAVVWEAGLQAWDPKQYSGPYWEKETGIKIKVVEVPMAKMFTKILQEHQARSGKYDVLNVIPSWLPDLARAGALEPLDDLVDKHGYREELQGIAPVYRSNQMSVDGTIYAFPDDGDVFVLYYRTDVLADPNLQAAFKSKLGYDLPAPPSTWKEFDEVAAFITETTGGKPYGCTFARDPTIAQYMFQERFRNDGGRFFDANSMKSTINSEIGVTVFEQWLAENKVMPPGAQTWGFTENLSAFLRGDSAMTVSWPSTGRWAAGYGGERHASNQVPKTQVAGKVGYAMPPGGHPELAAGFSLAVSASSQKKDAAYLFIQLLNSKDISSERVQLPYTLRDPFRSEHFGNKEFESRWPQAKDYLAALQTGAINGLIDLSITKADQYDEALRQGIARLWRGEEPRAVLDHVAGQWDATTDQVGVDNQKAAYQAWAAKPNAYPSNK